MSETTITVPKTEYEHLREIAARFEMMKHIIEPDMFIEPPTKDSSGILRDFRQTGLYNEDFLESLEKGLSDSSYFSKSATH